MKRETIQNQYDGPRAPAKRFSPGQISLDYAVSDNAKEIDKGIRETIKGLRLSILAMGMALAKLKNRSLFIDLGYNSMNDYLEKLCNEMQVERSTVFNWLYIGEAYIKYRQDLERIEFTDADGPTKLPYIERALEKYEKREVFKKIKDMTLQKFKEYAKKEEAAAPASKIHVVGNQIFIGKKLAVTFSEELDTKTRSYLAKVTAEAGEALTAGEVLYTTRLYDMDELRRFDRRADNLKKEMRIGIRKRRK